jgi:hypothetical protein
LFGVEMPQIDDSIMQMMVLQDDLSDLYLLRADFDSIFFPDVVLLH